LSTGIFETLAFFPFSCIIEGNKEDKYARSSGGKEKRMETSGISAINRISTTEGISNRQTVKNEPMDSVSKKLQDEISNAQRQKRELSSKEDISVQEKVKKRQELQQEIRGLNAQLRQRQAEARREQKKEALADEMQIDKNNKKEEKGTWQQEAQAKGVQQQTSAKEAQEQALTKGTQQQQRLTKEVQQQTQAKRTQQQQLIMKGIPHQALTKGTQQLETQNDQVQKQDTLFGGISYKGSRTREITDADAKDAQKKDSDIKGMKNQEDEEKDKKANGTGISRTEMLAMVAAASAMEQTRRQDTVITRMEDGIVILKGEIQQDKARGADVEKKQAELEKQEARVQWASTVQLSKLDRVHHSAQEDARTKALERKKEAETTIKTASDGGLVINASDFS